jgi:hypothetical protein
MPNIPKDTSLDNVYVYGDFITDSTTKKPATSSLLDYQDWAPWLLGMGSRDLTDFQLDSSFSSSASSSTSHRVNELVKTNSIDKYLYTIREIVSTEEKFLALIRALMEDFLQPLWTVMTPDEKRATNVNIQALYKLHTDLYAELHAACLSEANRTGKLCSVFSSYQKR